LDKAVEHALEKKTDKVVEERLLEVALKESDKSNCKKVHFGAILYRENGKVILGRGHNRALERFHLTCLKPTGYKIGSNPGLCKAVHAEWDAIYDAVRRGYGHDDIQSSTLYIAGKYPDGRVRHHSHFSCTVCIRLLKLYGIQEIVRYDENGEVSHISVNDAWKSAFEEFKQGGGEVIA
jgi:deoxycytidylate deaminase